MLQLLFGHCTILQTGHGLEQQALVRNGTTFGVCLIMQGEEVGKPAMPATFGCEAVIEDFDTVDAVLVLRLHGRRRFRMLRTRVRDTGLVVGEIEWREPDADDELRPEHALLATVLEKILEQIDPDLPALSQQQLDNAAWVGWRLAELLPLNNAQRLGVLQMNDVHQRLERLLALM
jgi:Lon protease-like protein